RRGPVPELARRYAAVTAEVELTSAPRLARPRVHGNRTTPPAVLVDADVRRLQRADGTAVTTRTPVRIIVGLDVGLDVGTDVGPDPPMPG
ncbi:hypothetical protein NGM37_33565, partial [Streptomyces sp. TRM76130]|nr:hypothetical protein [Streptomyces sp. TRM76130]